MVFVGCELVLRFDPDMRGRRAAYELIRVDCEVEMPGKGIDRDVRAVVFGVFLDWPKEKAKIYPWKSRDGQSLSEDPNLDFLAQFIRLLEWHPRGCDTGWRNRLARPDRHMSQNAKVNLRATDVVCRGKCLYGHSSNICDKSTCARKLQPVSIGRWVTEDSDLKRAW
jgi:hypothetical protein